MLYCGYTLTDFPISIRLTSLALWQSNDCPSASKPTLMNMNKYFMWIHYERLQNHNKAKRNKTVCIFLGYTVPCYLGRYLTQTKHNKAWHICIIRRMYSLNCPGWLTTSSIHRNVLPNSQSWWGLLLWYCHSRFNLSDICSLMMAPLAQFRFWVGSFFRIELANLLRNNAQNV